MEELKEKTKEILDHIEKIEDPGERIKQKHNFSEFLLSTIERISDNRDRLFFLEEYKNSLKDK